MKPSNKLSTLRTRGVSIVNCAGNVCRIASRVPFNYGPNIIDEKSSQDDYRFEIGGQYFGSLPRPIELMSE